MDGYCLITGAASGMGLAFAEIFFNKGYNLVLIDKDLNGLKRVKYDFEKRKGRTIYIIHRDLSHEGSATGIYEEVAVKLGLKVRILINNAGFGIFGFFSEVSDQEQDALI